MADAKISELLEADELDGSELVPVVQGATTKYTTTELIAALVSLTGGPRALGIIAANGTITASEGVDSVIYSGGSPGIYEIVFTTGLFSTTPVFTATAILAEGEPQVLIENINSGSVQLRTRDSAGTEVNAAFHFSAQEIVI